ncbi:hypothetical protein BH09VER1_BH09VER1_08390 [soil metagenome]
MAAADSKLTITIPTGNPRAVAASSRYRNDCRLRKGDQYVILQYTLAGEGKLRWKGREWSVPAGHALLCLVPERITYFYPKAAKEPWEFAWVNIYGELARYYSRALRHAHGPVLPLAMGSAPALELLNLATVARKRKAVDPHTTTFAVSSFFLNWQRLLDVPDGRAGDAVEVVQKICQTRFREPLGLKELAAQAEVSREHLTRIFTERVGVSPARYLRQMRLAAARNILSSPQVTQKEAADRAGFSSVQALQRALRKSRS